MKKTFKVACIALALVFGFSTADCSGSGGDKIVKSAAELKAYLGKQSSNSPDKPIEVTMNANDLAFEDIAAVITSSGKYVSLDLSGSPITAIPDYAFLDMDRYEDTQEGCTGLTSIILPKSVTSIGFGAFGMCTDLTSITIPNSVASIGDWAFAGCDSLASIAIPDGVASIGDGAFRDCTSLASVTIPDSVTSIGEEAFYYCTDLTSVTFQGTITSGNFSSNDSFPGDLRAKYLAGGIGTYTRPSGENRIWTKQSESAQSATPAQTTTEKPNAEADFSVGLTVDGKGVAITGYKGKATTVRIPATIQGLPVREIGKAFSFNRTITNVVIPEGVTTIGEVAFHECINLRTVSLPETLTSIGSAAFGTCRALESINLPTGLKEIGDGAFAETSLTSISLPTGLAIIDGAAFKKTKIRSVIIPEGVSGIGGLAFEECKNLTSVTLPSTIRIINGGAFNDCSSLTTLSIPETVTKITFDGDFYDAFYGDAFKGCHKLDLKSQAALRRVGYTGSF